MSTTKIDRSFFEFSKRLPVGMIVPVFFDAASTPDRKPFVELIGRETDEVIQVISNDPEVEFRLGVIPFSGPRKLILMWFLIRISGDSAFTYEIAVNLADPNTFRDFDALAQQQIYEIVMCGETTGTIIRVQMPSFMQDLGDTLMRAKQYCSLDWHNKDFFERLEWAQKRTNGPDDLWCLFGRSDVTIQELLQDRA